MEVERNFKEERKKTDKGRRLLYLGDKDVAIVTGGTRGRSLSRHYATSPKVAGSIPDGVTGIFR